MVVFREEFLLKKDTCPAIYLFYASQSADISRLANPAVVVASGRIKIFSSMLCTLLMSEINKSLLVLMFRGNYFFENVA